MTDKPKVIKENGVYKVYNVDGTIDMFENLKDALKDVWEYELVGEVRKEDDVRNNL